MKVVATILATFASLVYSSEYQNNFKYQIENTTWIVPPSTLLAYQYSSSAYTAVTDQTVWIIDNYDGGYFFGNSYTAIVNPPNPTTYTQKKLIGTVTDGGAVYITFIPAGSISTDDLVNGIGTFVKLQGSYQFVMQMNSGSTTDGLSHWSYMISITESSPYYNDLPGVNESLPQFLANF
jgi:hypothetical protein